MAGSKHVFMITADSQRGPRWATRTVAGSALCLADDWAEDGCTNILVTDETGKAFDREAFRATLPIVRRMAERRR